jgi:hypothetical protein
MTEHVQVASYALGLLDPIEMSAFEVHLAECDECADRLETFLPVGDLMADVEPGDLFGVDGVSAFGGASRADSRSFPAPNSGSFPAPSSGSFPVSSGSYPQDVHSYAQDSSFHPDPFPYEYQSHPSGPLPIVPHEPLAMRYPSGFETSDLENDPLLTGGLLPDEYPNPRPQTGELHFRGPVDEFPARGRSSRGQSPSQFPRSRSNQEPDREAEEWATRGRSTTEPPISEFPTRTGEFPTRADLRRGPAAGDFPVRGRAGGHPPMGEFPTRERQGRGLPAGEFPTHERQSRGLPAGEFPTGEFPTRERPSRGLPTGEFPTQEFPVRDRGIADRGRPDRGLSSRGPSTGGIPLDAAGAEESRRIVPLVRAGAKKAQPQTRPRARRPEPAPTTTGKSGRRSLMVMASAAAVLGAVVGAGAVAASPLSKPGDSAIGTAVSSTNGHLSHTDPKTGVHADVLLTSKSWGTLVSFTTSNVDGPRKCRLVAVKSSGNSEVLSTWLVPKQGYSQDTQPPQLSLQTSTSLASKDIASLRVEDIDAHNTVHTLVTVKN